MEDLLIKIKNYEIGLLKNIKKYINSSNFNDPEKLKEANNLWYKDKEKCQKIYGHISYWDTSKITCMCYLFFGFTNFNEDLSRWNISKVTDLSNWNLESVDEMYENFIFHDCDIKKEYMPDLPIVSYYTYCAINKF